MTTLIWNKKFTCAEALVYAEQIKAEPKASPAEKRRAERILGLRLRLEEIPDVEYRLRRSRITAMMYRDSSVILDHLRMLEPRESAQAKRTPVARTRLKKLLACMGFQCCTVDDKHFLLMRRAAA